MSSPYQSVCQTREPGRRRRRRRRLRMSAGADYIVSQVNVKTGG